MPPGRKSSVPESQVNPAGPHHFERCSSFVYTIQTNSRGASNVRAQVKSWALLSFAVISTSLGFEIGCCAIAAVHIERYGVVQMHDLPFAVLFAEAMSDARPKIGLFAVTLRTAHVTHAVSKGEVAGDFDMQNAKFEIDRPYPGIEPSFDNDLVAAFKPFIPKGRRKICDHDVLSIVRNHRAGVLGVKRLGCVVENAANFCFVIPSGGHSVPDIVSRWAPKRSNALFQP